MILNGGLEMKKIFILLALSMVLSCAACGANEEEPFAVIEAKDCYRNAGYVEFILGAETSAEYTFTAENPEAVQWRIYVFDQAFDDGFRYIAQAAEPVLVGDGKVSVQAGQFVYIYCSANEFTVESPNTSAKLNINLK
jgi:hypothetical protein